ncbi:hypothetical protein ABZ540_35180 [Nocardia xishanensis]|uniref:hypothetical protein n=1 Tax=Nocardia xishanensis TaxID=238964 RepID=UPI00340A710D
MLNDQPDSLGLGRLVILRWHDLPILSRKEASTRPGAIQDNVFGDVAKRNFDANTETLIQRNPEVIILLTQGTQTPESARNALRERPELAGLRAIRDNRIIAIPFGYTGPGPVAVEGLEVLDRELGAQR